MARYTQKSVTGIATRLLALVALVGFQLAYAGHETQHAAGDLTETCAACAHLDQNAPAAPDACACALVVPSGHTHPLAPQAAPTRAERGAYFVRAPPLC